MVLHTKYSYRPFYPFGYKLQVLCDSIFFLMLMAPLTQHDAYGRSLPRQWNNYHGLLYVFQLGSPMYECCYIGYLELLQQVPPMALHCKRADKDLFTDFHRTHTDSQ